MVRKKEEEANGEDVEEVAVEDIAWKEENGEDELGAEELGEKEDDVGQDKIGEEERIKGTVCWRIRLKSRIKWKRVGNVVGGVKTMLVEDVVEDVADEVEDEVEEDLVEEQLNNCTPELYTIMLLRGRCPTLPELPTLLMRNNHSLYIEELYINCPLVDKLSCT